MPTVRPDRRDRPDRVEHVLIPPAASTARLDPFGCRRALAAQELPRASAAEQGALAGIGARAAGSEGSGGRGHLSERPGWPSGAPISRGSTVSMIVFGGRRGPYRGQVPGVAAGRSNVARLGVRGASGRMPLPTGPATRRLGLESVKASAPLPTAARRPCVVVVVVVAATPNYLRQASQNLGKYLLTYYRSPVAQVRQTSETWKQTCEQV